MGTIAERDNHQKLWIKLISKLEQWIQEGELRAAPTSLYINSANRVKPDIFWVATDNDRCRVDESGYWHGAPDLIIEVLSPMSEAVDRGLKFELYESCRVHEYWLVNPEAQFIEVFVLLNQRYTRHGLFQPEESFSSGVLNARTIDVSEIFGQSPVTESESEEDDSKSTNPVKG